MLPKSCVALVASYDITFITKFGTSELSILILDISAIIHQSPCWYVVTTSNIGLYGDHS